MVFRQSGYLDCPGRDVRDVRDVSKFGGTMSSTIRLVGTLWDADIWTMSRTVRVRTISFGHCPIPALPSGTLVRYLLDNSDYKGGRRRATDSIWSTKIFIIESMMVKSRQPVMYRLADMDNEQSIPKRYFVREELLIVPSDTELPPVSIAQ